MTNFEDHIKKSTSDVRLTDAEKARMKSVLQSYMRFHPLPEPITTYTITRDWFIFLQRPVAAALVLVLVVGSGVSYAAEGALPGDALYTLKTGVNEPLKIAFAGSAEEEAEVKIELAERRIQEASALAAEDRLDDATEARLAVALDAHAESAAILVEEIDEEDAGAAAELSARFETRLRAREDVLAQIRERDDSKDERETSVERSIRTASSRVALLRERAEVRLALAPALGGNFEEEVVTMAMKAAPVALSAESADMAMSLEIASKSVTSAQTEISEPKVERKTAERMQKAAENKLKEVRKKARDSEQAKSNLEIAESLLEEGEDHLDDDAYASAFFSFRASLEQSERASIFLESAGILEKATARKNARALKKEREDAQKEQDRTEEDHSGREAEPEDDRTSSSETSDDRDDEDEREEEHDDEDDSDKDTELNLLQRLNISL